MEEIFPLRYEVVPTWESHSFVSFSELFQKDNLSFLELESIFFREKLIFFSEFIVEAFDLGEDIADSVFHKRVLVACADNHLRMTQYAIPEGVSFFELLDNLAFFAWHLCHHIVTIWIDLSTE